ncbi:MAG TPA: hypothetical protein P5149_10450 [Candidatus Competibacteraceae bacterium]|nr:hypothetical protein [Candidatus Competibacteraceae bacterium]MCP5132553.1 hypothetical protein [Gammaproteobacteria bacterium]HPF59357.1 hypothetical protein [Candidatus Competibacteraceae bacterium]HRY18812.1 hypothetical protein [Candidatus Competibacteraceae bacterium]
MKTILTATAFALTLGLTGLTHASSFNDRGPVIDTTPVRMERQDLSHLPAVTGFNQQSHPVETAVSTASHRNHGIVLGANCDLIPRTGFQNSTSTASC